MPSNSDPSLILPMISEELLISGRIDSSIEKARVRTGSHCSVFKFMRSVLEAFVQSVTWRPRMRFHTIHESIVPANNTCERHASLTAGTNFFIQRSFKAVDSGEIGRPEISRK